MLSNDSKIKNFSGSTLSFLQLDLPDYERRGGSYTKPRPLSSAVIEHFVATPKSTAGSENMPISTNSALLILLGLVSINTGANDADTYANKLGEILTKIDQINKTLDGRMDDITGQ